MSHNFKNNLIEKPCKCCVEFLVDRYLQPEKPDVCTNGDRGRMTTWNFFTKKPPISMAADTISKMPTATPANFSLRFQASSPVVLPSSLMDDRAQLGTQSNLSKFCLVSNESRPLTLTPSSSGLTPARESISPVNAFESSVRATSTCARTSATVFPSPTGSVPSK